MLDPAIVARCKYCRDRSDTQSTLLNPSTNERIIYCRTCGEEGPVRLSLREAIDAWNDLHLTHPSK